MSQMFPDIKHIELEQEWQGFLGNNDKPIVIVFYSIWCAPSLLLAPSFMRVAESYGKKVNVIAVDITKNSHLPVEMGIRAIPTVMSCDKEGNPITGKIGMMDSEVIQTIIEEAL